MSTLSQQSVSCLAFICHAGNDKDVVASPLAAALSRFGVAVWLDTDQLRIGDRLRVMIDSALSACDIAVVVFSPEFYLSPWASGYELDGIISRFVVNELLLLPVLHNIDRAELIARAPSLGSCISRSTADFTIDEIAREIAQIVGASSARAEDTVHTGRG